jgi:hypothetical protein
MRFTQYLVGKKRLETSFEKEPSVIGFNHRQF